tara:strand:+ start:4781 stop:5734 length:954 start_codon:yes stop_codon:yes gene_type:complete
MLILENLTAEVPDTNAYHFNFKKFSDDDKKTVLLYGYNSSNNKLLETDLCDYKKILFNNWAPCEFAQVKDHNGKSPMDYEEKFDVVYSICPYTVEWMNNLHLGREYRYIFYPFCKTLTPEKQEKKYDVIYHGGIHAKEHVDCLKVMSKFNYRYCTMTTHINSLTRHFLPYATNTNLKFKDKINLVAESKVSVCYNMAQVHKEHIPRIKSRPEYKKNLAFSSIDTLAAMPQFKTRFHEAAISRTLNLVRKDDWNVIEDFYTPEEDFVYFDNEIDLEKKIKEVLNNWGDYQQIVENAYIKSMNYTTEKFIEKIKKDNTQ